MIEPRNGCNGRNTETNQKDIASKIGSCKQCMLRACNPRSSQWQDRNQALDTTLYSFLFRHKIVHLLVLLVSESPNHVNLQRSLTRWMRASHGFEALMRTFFDLLIDVALPTIDAVCVATLGGFQLLLQANHSSSSSSSNDSSSSSSSRDSSSSSSSDSSSSSSSRDSSSSSSSDSSSSSSSRDSSSSSSSDSSSSSSSRDSSSSSSSDSSSSSSSRDSSSSSSDSSSSSSSSDSSSSSSSISYV
ncbi:uncharacterized protein LOC130965417 [Arachis stenosperma]|uniref:uncharacterized protein LOC130965417 n=1 Tax=Arachis stenosperma TaxID=217475 RepID=UPI0025AB68CA|nr:uncharacterized protein LOC130965417 [Arachis stenosperma]